MNKEDKLNIGRHSLAHILANAVTEYFKGAKLTIGPVIDGGFYYDFDLGGKKIEKEDYSGIEKRMQKILNQNLDFERVELSKKEALEIFKTNEYKVELINELPEDEAISAYKTGDEFIDLCRGPHVDNTSKIGNWAYKIDRVSGAYWKGDENNKMLTRVYVYAFTNKKDLSKFLDDRKNALDRDHNKLGKELKIFMTDENIGQGLPLLMPKGARIINTLKRYVEDEAELRDYQITRTPFMAKSDLYKISGHWDHYRDGMFIIGDDSKESEILALRPMTCPFQFMIYKNGIKSYKDLPIRYIENSNLFRKESSGEMHGLIRIRQFELADAHIICTPKQLEKEFNRALDFIYNALKVIGLEDSVTYRFSKWSKDNNKGKYIDKPDDWEKTQIILKSILDKSGVKYVEAEDEAAFYGPKLDIQTKNVHGKEDTLLTIQIDFALSERFDMSYIDDDGKKNRPYIIHQSIMGCYERTLALLIEKYNGNFPLWFSPEHVRLITINDNANEMASKIEKELKQLKVYVSSDLRNGKIGKKIREAQIDKVPYMIILGDKEVETETISVRKRNGEQESNIDLNEFYEKITKEIEDKYIDKSTIK